MTRMLKHSLMLRMALCKSTVFGYFVIVTFGVPGIDQRFDGS